MAGLYLLHRLREGGSRAVVVEAADDVGGTWYWNRYPGARCDVPSLDYQYSWDPELEAEWEWSEKYATQPEILRYLQHVADRYDLRRDIRFETRLDAATWDDAAKRWRVEAGGEQLVAQHVVMATGCLSVPKDPDIPGTDRFGGEVYVTGRWPHEGVDFTGKKVAVIGTGSSAIQSIPLIAQEAEQMTVFQRTANYSTPALNGPVPDELREAVEGDPAAYHEEARWSRAGVVLPVPMERVADVDEAERNRRFEWIWNSGHLLAANTQFADLVTNAEANDVWAEFVRNKVRSIVDDPDTAEILCPRAFPYGTKRACLDSGYYETFNLPHVRLVDLHRSPIDTITEDGMVLGGAADGEQLEFDAIVYATGFDAMTGALVSVDVEGRGGVTLKQKWADGPLTYLGLMTVDFPNFYMITGPQSPSVLSNMAVSIEQHVEFVDALITELRDRGAETIEPTQTAEAGWVQHTHDCADITLFQEANSWYMGANVPGKPRVILPYLGGVGTYRGTCDEVLERDLLGFAVGHADGETTANDGIVNGLQLDIMIMLEFMGQMELPPIESLPPAEARAFMEASAAARRPGPEVGEIVDGTLPGPAGDLDYRLYRPDTPGPHPVVCYFHGGGWVLGAADSDDPFCRELCVESESIVVSVNYRHAPEDPFPAAAHDAWAGLRWVAANAESLGGRADALVVAGWSAGGNLAAGVAQRARDEGGPALCGTLLLTPVTDGSKPYPSLDENAEGYVLTKALMEWFWDHYAPDAADRTNPLASPLLADDLGGLPPTAIFTAQFDPLRDEGKAYAEALSAAGAEVELHEGRGQIHTSLTAVDMLTSSDGIRAEIARAVRGFFERAKKLQPSAGE